MDVVPCIEFAAVVGEVDLGGVRTVSIDSSLGKGHGRGEWRRMGCGTRTVSPALHIVPTPLSGDLTLVKSLHDTSYYDNQVPPDIVAVVTLSDPERGYTC